MNSLRKIIGFIVALHLLLISSCSLFFNNSSKMYAEAYSNAPYDAIIVPGVPLEGDKWSDVMKMRVYWSVHLFNEGIAKNIIYSGSAVYTPYIEAEVMKAYALELGVPEEHIFMDRLAEHSTENIYYSEKLGKKSGFSSIALATDPFQIKMTSSFRKKHYKEMFALPIQYDIMSEMELTDPDISFEGYEVEDFVSIKEREGFFKRFRGTLGHNIKDSLKVN